MKYLVISNKLPPLEGTISSGEERRPAQLGHYRPSSIPSSASAIGRTADYPQPICRPDRTGYSPNCQARQQPDAGRTGDNDYYLDKDGLPVPDNSKPSHILPDR